MAFDPAEQRRIMGRFATGVTVILTPSDPPAGLTANSVTSLSLDPPLVLFALDRNSSTREAFQTTQCFSVCILTAEQQAISNRFASRGPKDLSDLELITAETGAPILADSLAWVDCRITDVLPGGDHEIFVGEVVAGDARDEGEPLLFYAGAYRGLAAQED